MIERKSYTGILNGIHGIWCDRKPEGIENVVENTWYQPDEGKVFTKDGEIFDFVVLKDDEKITNYVEIIDPRTAEGQETEE